MIQAAEQLTGAARSNDFMLDIMLNADSCASSPVNNARATEQEQEDPATCDDPEELLRRLRDPGTVISLRLAATLKRSVAGLWCPMGSGRK
jgi:hypothetical protein